MLQKAGNGPGDEATSTPSMAVGELPEAAAVLWGTAGGSIINGEVKPAYTGWVAVVIIVQGGG